MNKIIYLYFWIFMQPLLGVRTYPNLTLSIYRNKFLTLALVCNTNTMKLILKPSFKCYQFMERPFSKLSFDGDLHWWNALHSRAHTTRRNRCNWRVPDLYCKTSGGFDVLLSLSRHPCWTYDELLLYKIRHKPTFEKFFVILKLFLS